MSGSCSMCFIHIAIGLILVSDLSKHSFKWWMHSCTAMSWGVQSNIVIIIWYSYLLGKSDGRHNYGVVCSSPSKMVWNSLDTPLLVSWALIHTIQGIPYGIFPLWGLSPWYQCKDAGCLLVGVQLRFFLCSGAIITRCWSQFISYLLVF